MLQSSAQTNPGCTRANPSCRLIVFGQYRCMKNDAENDATSCAPADIAAVRRAALLGLADLKSLRYRVANPNAHYPTSSDVLALLDWLIEGEKK